MHSRLPKILKQHEESILAEWLRLQQQGTRSTRGMVDDGQLRQESTRFLRALEHAAAGGNLEDVDAAPFDEVRTQLTELSRSRALAGFSPCETAMFVFSLKKPLYNRLRQEFGSDAAPLAAEVWVATELLDRLGLYTTEAYQRSREGVIERQQRELLELSTPVTRLWDGVLGAIG